MSNDSTSSHPHQGEQAAVIEELWRAIENLQDALHKVEWVRSHAGSWICAFCGGLSIEHGGDDHRDGCEWQRLMLLGPKDVDESVARRLALLSGESDRPLVEQKTEQGLDARRSTTGDPTDSRTAATDTGAA